MSTKILKKSYQDYDCIEGAKRRLRHLYSSFDRVVLNFSGGKDSNAMLYVTLEVARELGKTPLEVVYVDHEIEGKHTIDLIEAVNEMEDVNLIVYAVPFALRNAASMNSPYWFPWHPAEKDLWCREKPDYAVTELKGHVFEYDPKYKDPEGEKYMSLAVKKYTSFQRICELHAENIEATGESVVSLVGIRAEESMARYTIMSRKKNECYLSKNKAYPIYDWRATDVWKYIRETGLPYNHEYDLMNKTNLFNKLNKQRVGSIFAEESLRTLHQWREFYGDFWHKILNRTYGIKTAWRYNNKGIYTGTKIEKEDGITWSELTQKILTSMSPSARDLSVKGIKKIITWHKGRTDYPISENEADSNPLTGISWEFLCRIAIRGDSKERNLQKVTNLARTRQDKLGMTRDEAVTKYGSTKYKSKYYGKKR